MSAKQRNKNRATADELRFKVRQHQLESHVCENCGERGGHWVQIRGSSIRALLTGVDDQEGFWTCPKLYGVDGRRSEP